jgi:hypothetical protein
VFGRLALGYGAFYKNVCALYLCWHLIDVFLMLGLWADFEEDPPLLYKNELLSESDKWCFKSLFKKIVYFKKDNACITGNEQKTVQTLTMPCGNFLCILFGLGFWPYFLWKEDPPKLYKKKSNRKGIRQITFKQLALEFVFFST